MLESNSNSKVLLVIDWSNIMFRSLFMHQLFGGTATGTYDRIEDLQSFTNKFAIDVCSIVNMFKPNNVIIATDSQHAWRKDVLPGEDGYKSNREKDPKINWENIYKCSDDLQEILHKKGMNIANVDHAEADDIIALVKEVVYEKYPDYNIIIVSADADIRQLISFNKDTKQYCVVYNTTGRGKNSKRRMYVTEDFKEWVESPDQCDIFFVGYDSKKQYIKDLLQTNQIIELYVDNPNDVVLNKILCGDDGDSVPSFYGYYKNGKYVRITPAKAKKIIDYTEADSVKKLVESVNKFPAIFEKICKKTVDDIDFSERLHRQRVLVELNSNLFPPHIREYKESIDYMIRNTSFTVFQGLRAQEFLKGTEYENASQKKALDADVIRDFTKNIGGGQAGFVPTVNGVPVQKLSNSNSQQQSPISVNINGVDFFSNTLI